VDIYSYRIEIIFLQLLEHDFIPSVPDMDGGIVAGVGEVTQIVFFKAQRFNLLPKLLSTLYPFGIIDNISSKCLNDDLPVPDHYNLNILVTGLGRILLERTGNVETHPLAKSVLYYTAVTPTDILQKN